jgi:hypothetical protein
MNALTDHEFEPGSLVEWVPTADSLAAAARAEPHPAPASYFQQNHIERALANDAAGAVHSPWLSTVFDLPGPLDLDALGAAWQRWVRRHGTLRTWFRPENDGLVRYALAPEEIVLTRQDLGEFSTATEIRDHLLHRFANGTSALGWPAFVLGAVQREESATVYFAVDHAHTDGYSIFQVFDELRQLHEEETGGPAAQLPEVGDHVEHAELERERAAQVPADTAAAAPWLDFLDSGDVPSFPLPLGLDQGRARTKRLLERELFDDQRANAFARRCRELGASLFSGLLAALAITSRELAGVEEYRTLTPVHTRDEPRWAAAQGWFINLVPVRFPVGTDFSTAVHSAEEAFARARRAADVPVPRLFELLSGGADLQGDPRSVLPIVSFIDARRIRGSQHWAQAGCQVLSGLGAGFDVPMWINRLREVTYLEASCPETPEALENVQRYLEHVAGVLDRVVDEGEHHVVAPAVAED